MPHNPRRGLHSSSRARSSHTFTCQMACRLLCSGTKAALPPRRARKLRTWLQTGSSIGQRQAGPVAGHLLCVSTLTGIAGPLPLNKT